MNVRPAGRKDSGASPHGCRFLSFQYACGDGDEIVCALYRLFEFGREQSSLHKVLCSQGAHLTKIDRIDGGVVARRHFHAIHDRHVLDSQQRRFHSHLARSSFSASNRFMEASAVPSTSKARIVSNFANCSTTCNCASTLSGMSSAFDIAVIASDNSSMASDWSL